MTLEELIQQVRSQINTRIELRNQYATELSTLRSADNVDETKVDELRGKKASVDAEIKALDEKRSGLEAELVQDQAVARLQSTVGGTTPAPANQREQRVDSVNERRTYSREADPKGVSFMRDVASDFLGNRDARERLSRHMTEEFAERGDQLTRGVTTGSAPGLVVPQYLVDMYASKGRPGRKFADQCRPHDLPETGMAVYIPRQTAKASVGIQEVELTPVEETDYEDEDITVKVRTAAGSQTVSRQSIERSLGTFDIVFDDLLKAYDSDLDNRILNSPVWGLLAVANKLTFTDDNPIAEELYRKILGASANVEDVLQDLDPDDLFTLMRGRRWAWLRGELTDKWPFIAQQGVPLLAGGTSDGANYAAGVRGYLPDGGPVVTDNNLPNNLGTATNEDPVVVVARQEAHLWEDPKAPLYIRADAGPSMKKLGVDLVVYGYFAFCADRVVDEQGTPKAVHQVITGTGLTPPVF